MKKSHPSAMRVMNRSELRALEAKKRNQYRLRMALVCLFFGCALGVTIAMFQ